MINRFFHSMCMLQGQVVLAVTLAAQPARVGLVVPDHDSSGCAIHSLGLEFTMRSGNSDGRGPTDMSVLVDTRKSPPARARVGDLDHGCSLPEPSMLSGALAEMPADVGLTGQAAGA